MTALLPDTHAHLDAAEFKSDLEAVINRAQEARIGPILAVGSDLASSIQAVAVAQRHNAVYAAVGVHPHEAARFHEERESVLALLDEEKVVAVGEIGLDYFRGRAPRAVQLVAFREQLSWARDRGLPVSIHNRDADDDVLHEVSIAGPRTILHCFSGTWEVARKALDRGCLISFAGNLTFPKAVSLRDVARRIPVERLLVESDSPVLAPQPRRGRRNEPALTRITGDTLAAEQNMQVSLLADAISANAATLFKWGTA